MSQNNKFEVHWKTLAVGAALGSLIGWHARRITAVDGRTKAMPLASDHAGAEHVVALGTTNKCKKAALRQSLAAYPGLRGYKVHALKVASGVAEQPMSLAETSQGARNRAKAAFDATPGCTIAFGIESGLFEQDGCWYDVCACAMWYGSEANGFGTHVGYSCAFQIPPRMMAAIRDGKAADLTIACNYVGITDDEQLGEHGGLIGILSHDRITVSLSLIQLHRSCCSLLASAACLSPELTAPNPYLPVAAAKVYGAGHLLCHDAIREHGVVLKA